MDLEISIATIRYLHYTDASRKLPCPAETGNKHLTRFSMGESEIKPECRR